MSDVPAAEFLGERYLLPSDPAVELYDEVRDLPIVDAHNHVDIVEIVEDRAWSDIWQLEGETDHYVWEMMRKLGVPEERITGDASNREKWQALAEVFPQLAGNPTYEWIHLDLRRRFGIDDVIRPQTADAIWAASSAALQRTEFRPQALLQAMRVEIMCTTDDPAVRLPYHERARDEVEHVRILPTWRPDKAMNVEKATWRPLVDRLAKETGIDTSSLEGFEAALQATHDHFDEIGCAASDHGLMVPWGHRVERSKAAAVHVGAVAGHRLNQNDIADYHAYMLHRFGEMNAVGPIRNHGVGNPS